MRGQQGPSKGRSVSRQGPALCFMAEPACSSRASLDSCLPSSTALRAGHAPGGQEMWEQPVVVLRRSSMTGKVVGAAGLWSVQGAQKRPAWLRGTLRVQR